VASAFPAFESTSAATRVTAGTSSRRSSNRFDRKKIGACHVTAGPGETGDKTEPDRVLTDKKDDRYRCGRGFGCEYTCRAARRYDDGDPTTDQVGRQRGQPIHLIAAPAVFDGDIFAFDEPCLSQALPKCGQPVRVSFGR
jgi:hypothetical protein